MEARPSTKARSNRMTATKHLATLQFEVDGPFSGGSNGVV